MKIFGIEIETKASLKNKLEITEQQLKYAQATVQNLVHTNNELKQDIEKYSTMFPLIVGDTVYDLQLRSASGRYTKKNASKQYSQINEVVVDEKNYFKLVARLGTDVFTSKDAAVNYLCSVCVD